MKNKKIISAIAAVSVLSLTTGASVFAAMTSPEEKPKDEIVAAEEVEENTAEADEEATETESAETDEEIAAETPDEAEKAEEETPKAGDDEEKTDEKAKPPVAEKDKPLGHTDIDVTDFFFEIKDTVDPNNYDYIPDTIKENWDNINKVKIHVDFGEYIKDETEKPAPPAGKIKAPGHHLDLDVTDLFYELKDFVNVDDYDVIPDDIKENWDNIKKIKVHVDFVKAAKDEEVKKPERPTPPAKDEEVKKPERPTPPAKDEEVKKPERPTPPAKDEEVKKPEPPTPPAKNEEVKKPEPPTPPHKLHEADKAADAENGADETIDTEISE